MAIDLTLHADADFSFYKGHRRHALYRRWNFNHQWPLLMVIGLNPSKANASKNDNTITKLIKVARHNTFGGLIMVNLFSYISTDPDHLITEADSEAQDMRTIVFYSQHCAKICFAWGNFKQAKERAEQVIKMFPDAYCLDHNKNGSPKHPLYCKDETQLVKFR